MNTAQSNIIRGPKRRVTTTPDQAGDKGQQTTAAPSQSEANRLNRTKPNKLHFAT